MSFRHKGLVGNETIYLTDFTLLVSVLAHMRYLVNPHPLFFPGAQKRSSSATKDGGGWLAGWLVGVGGGEDSTIYHVCLGQEGKGGGKGEKRPPPPSPFTVQNRASFSRSFI